ncbi:MAG: DegV family protein [Desulfobacterales bacterium]|nr:DegV family protein [Desulfobacterales bacterium]
MRRLIVTDSTSDLPAEYVNRYGIRVLPVTVILDGKSHRDGIDISRDVFYRNYDAYKTKSTQAIRYEEYALEYMQFTQKYDEILILHCSKHLSETCHIAEQVHQDFQKDHHCRVEIVDSKLCSMGLGMMVINAARSFETGKSMEETLAALRVDYENMGNFMALPTLKYLKKGGKISGFKALFGLAIGIKPVLQFDDGKLEVATKLFGKQKNMILSMLDTIREDIGDQAITLSIVHAREGGIVQNLKDVFEATFPCREIYVARFGPSIAINSGPDTTAVMYIKHPA